MIWEGIKKMLCVISALLTMLIAAGSFECAATLGGAVLYLLGAVVLAMVTRALWDSIDKEGW